MTRVYLGESESLPPEQRQPDFATWAEALHLTCEQLPSFSRLAEQCRANAAAAGAAVETILQKLKPTPPGRQAPPPPPAQDGGLFGSRPAHPRHNVALNSVSTSNGFVLGAFDVYPYFSQRHRRNGSVAYAVSDDLVCSCRCSIVR